MPQLPLVAWLVAAGVILPLLGLWAATTYAVPHAGGRRRVAGWPPGYVLGLGPAALLPWLVVWFAPPRIEVSIHGLGPLLGWPLVALLAFALLVLPPLGVLLSGVVWSVAWRRRRRMVPPVTCRGVVPDVACSITVSPWRVCLWASILIAGEKRPRR